MFNKLYKNESGQSLIIVALIISILIGFGALAVDVGAMVFQKSSMQNAADSAVLAGALLAPKISSDTDIIDIMKNDYAESNFKEDVTVVYTPDTDIIDRINKTVNITITQNVPKYLSGIFSKENRSMTVSAKAKYDIGWTGEALPLVNTGYDYTDTSSNLILRINKTPGDKSQITDFFSKNDNEGNPKYYVKYDDGVILDEGNGNTKSSIDETLQLNPILNDILTEVQVGDIFYLLSIKSTIMDAYLKGGNITVTDKFGNIVTRNANTSGFQAGDVIDPDMLVLIKVSFVSVKTSNYTEIELKYENKEYDITNVEEIPTGLSEYYVVKSKLIN